MLPNPGKVSTLKLYELSRSDHRCFRAGGFASELLYMRSTALLSIRYLNFCPKVYEFSLSTAHTGVKASSSICEYFRSVAVKVRMIHWIILVSSELFGLL
jgi:hypothetical protein